MTWWQIVCDIYTLLADVRRLKKNMLTRKDLDDAIAGVPATVAAAIVPVVQDAVQPFIDKAKANPEAGVDYTPEITSLGNLGPTISSSVARALTAHFAAQTGQPATDATDSSAAATDTSTTGTVASADATAATP